MKIKFDKVADAVYIKMAGGAVAKTVPMTDRFLMDVDADGNTIGFEILDASSQEDLVQSLERNLENGVPVNIVSGTPVAA